ncbi:MAG: hypothetical protein JXA30_08645 [Deltaproteobacteria bacterium]|nr:hypothetical protein [Deltaproteobacteria bacterium]
MLIRTIQQAILVVFAVGVANPFLASCKGEESGSLQLSFQLGSGKSCDEFGIERVKAFLTDSGEEYDESVDCDKGEIRFNDVEAGTYRLKLFGYDADKAAVKDSEEEETTIKSGKTTTIETPIRLIDAPVTLKLRWDFEFSDCKKAGLGGFFITAFSSDGSDVLFDGQDILCNSNTVDDDGYHTIPDEGRDLKGNNFGEVEIQPYDANSAPLGEAIRFVFDSPGPGGEIRLSLSCDDTGCRGSGEPD